MVKAGRKFLGRNIMRSKVPGAHFVCQDAQLSPAFIGVHPAHYSLSLPKIQMAPKDKGKIRECF